MRTESLTTKNKYGQTVTLPPQSDTKGMQQIAAILEENGISYEKEFCFDETGFRRMKFDFAVMRDGKPKLLIEYDGRVHYEEIASFCGCIAMWMAASCTPMMR